MKVLVISYYSFPLNAVPCYRIESICEGFSKKGADVTLITRHWDETFTDWEDVLSSHLEPPKIVNEKGYRQIYLPFQAKFRPVNCRLVNTLKTVKSYVRGNIQPEIDAYSNFKEYALHLLQREADFDLIYVSAPPHNLVKLANYLNKKTKVPFAVDFRDFLNDQYLFLHPNLTIRQKVLNRLTLLHIKRYIKKAKLITTVSPRLQSIFESIFKIKTVLALNGYEQKYFSNDQLQDQHNDVFTIRYIGTAYKGLNFDPIIGGLKKFKSTYPDKSFKIELIGIHNESLEQSFKKEFSKEELTIVKNRIPKKKVVDKVVNADVLLLVWNLYKDNYGTKVFDYLASGSHVLLSPPDNGVVQKLIEDYDNGSVANSPTEVFSILDSQYACWQKGDNKTRSNAYPEFARENIVAGLYETLKKEVK